MRTRDARLDGFMERVAGRPDTCDVSAAMLQPSTGWSWNWTEPGAPQQYFIASITKLYTTTVILQLVDQGALELSAPVHQLLSEDVLGGLHHQGGEDHSRDITVEHLVRHTSGLPDYFEGKRADGSTLFRDIIDSDRAWTPADVLDWTRGMPAQFTPGAPGKAHYSDSNYQLLGMVVEAVDGRSFSDALHARIIEPLGLTRTFLYSADTHGAFPDIAEMNWGKRPLALRQAMGSFWADGSIVSTAPESVAFLKAMLDGTLFGPELAAQLTAQWNKIFFPLEYGLGLMRFKLSRWISPFPPPVEFVGHSGASGVVCFYAPAHDLYISMAVNQVKSRSLVYRLMSRATAIAT